MARKQKLFEQRSDSPARLGIVINARNPRNKQKAVHDHVDLKDLVSSLQDRVFVLKGG
jgi:hypothetical protein